MLESHVMLLRTDAGVWTCARRCCTIASTFGLQVARNFSASLLGWVFSFWWRAGEKIAKGKCQEPVTQHPTVFRSSV